MHPRAEVRALLERVETGEGLGVGLLDEVLGIGRVPGHPQRCAVELIEERHGQFLELFGALFCLVGLQLDRQPELLTCWSLGV